MTGDIFFDWFELMDIFALGFRLRHRGLVVTAANFTCSLGIVNVQPGMYGPSNLFVISWVDLNHVLKYNLEVVLLVFDTKEYSRLQLYICLFRNKTIAKLVTDANLYELYDKFLSISVTICSR